MENAAGAVYDATAAHGSEGGQRLLYPSACALNPSCTVAVLSTVAGVRAYALITASEQREGKVVQSLHPLPPSMAAAPSEVTSDTARIADDTAPSTALWRTPVYTATVAGDSALVAVVFRARPLVFVPHTVLATGAEEEQSGDGATSPVSSRSQSGCGVPAHVDASLAGDEETRESPAPAADLVKASALVAAEAECRRYVYLFDATSGTCLSALHFCGSPVLALRANSSVLLVAAVDLFHLVELRTLRYIRQQSMYKPLNPRGVLDLSAAVPSPKADGGGTSYAVAFPQSARGYRGDVTVLTLHCVPPAPRRQALREGGSRAASGASSSMDAERPSTSTTAAAAAATTSSGFRTATPAMEQRTIPAHHHAVAHLRFRPDGQLLATASELGTTVKLFDSNTGALLVELQRGHRPAAVLSLAVQQDAYRIAALSANGTLHVFDCTAVVQCWEAARTAGTSPSVPAHSVRSPTPLGSASAASKVRAEWKHKVTLMAHPPVDASAASTKSTGRRLGSAVMAAAAVTSRASPAAPNADVSGAAPGAGAAANDGWLNCESGFAADGRSVWVVQVHSTVVQQQQAASMVPSRSASLSPRLCVGSLTCFPLPLLSRDRFGGAAQPAEKGAKGCHYVVV
ncbi:hypothetical protein LSCM1_04451 [Leishmania martiniquensis]|uniref:Uncharacterized protein n=1 Tax=Leishmania martiniquensis TaxID=1580590 RepID=A0A836GXP2_9TRYP|nr:hypothetical protein LSCM1_04451 [Leishmania martiniquensis]